MIHSSDLRYKIITPMAGKQMARGWNMMGKMKKTVRPSKRGKRKGTK